MPLDRLMKDPLYNFLGVNLRRDGLSMAEGDLATAINADLHTKPGVLLLRRGRRRLDASDFTRALRYIGRHNNRLYRVAGTELYRGISDTPVLLLNTLQDTARVTMLSYQPLNDPVAWTFIAQDGTHYKDDGRATTPALERWGIAPPNVTLVLAVGAAGALTGTYGARYTYARVVSGNVAHESNPCDAPTPIALTSDQLSIPVVASTDPQVTHIRVYRTLAGGTLYLFDQQVANVSATIASTQTDAELGAALEEDNYGPPAMDAVAEYQSHFFAVGDPANPDYLWYAKRFRPESWPRNQFLRIGTADDPLQTVVRQAGFLGVFSQRSKYRVSGNAVSGFSWAETLNSRGTVAPQAVLIASAGVVFWARDGIFATNFLQADQELSQAIAPLFEPDGAASAGYEPIDWDAASTFSLAEYKRRIYAAYQTTSGTRMMAVYSQETRQWFFYTHPCTSLYYDESRDRLLMGSSTGITSVLEVGSSDDNAVIAMTATTRSLSGVDRFVRKIFRFLKIDVQAVDVSGGTVTLWIDDVAQQTIPVTSPLRTALRAPLRLQDMHGYSWRLTISGSVQLYGAEMLYSPLEDV